MFTITFKELGYCERGNTALTLHPLELGVNESGWTIEGEVHEDYFEWVNEFQAVHPDFGRVWGDYESIVYADSREAFEHFHLNQPPEHWDYYDI